MGKKLVQICVEDDDRKIIQLVDIDKDKKEIEKKLSNFIDRYVLNDASSEDTIIHVGDIVRFRNYRCLQLTKGYSIGIVLRTENTYMGLKYLIMLNDRDTITMMEPDIEKVHCSEANEISDMIYAITDKLSKISKTIL